MDAGGDQRSEPLAPKADALAGDGHALLGWEIHDIALVRRETSGASGRHKK
nr:hypothetical protein [Amylibacter sp.]